MSNYHHWGTKSFGIRYKCYKSSVNKLDSAEITLEIFSAWCIAISSIRFVLDILVECSQNKAAIEKIKELTKQLKNPQNITSTDCS